MGWRDWSYSLKGMVMGGVITGGIAFLRLLFMFIKNIVQKDYFMNDLAETIGFYVIFGLVEVIGYAIFGLVLGALIGWIIGKNKNNTIPQKQTIR